MKVLHADDPEFSTKLRAELGLQPDDQITVVGPQFERTPGMRKPASPPAHWPALRQMSRDELAALGCSPWDEPDERGRVLMLFPWEWYEHIPEGFELVSINGEREPFQRGTTDDDKRFGCLAYGIEVTA